MATDDTKDDRTAEESDVENTSASDDASAEAPEAPEPETEATAAPASAAPAAKAERARPTRPRPHVDPEPLPPPAQSPAKRAILFAIVVLTLTGGFFAFARIETPFDKQPPKWRPGQVVDMELTVVKEDAQNLACASPTEIEGRRCEFANKSDKNPAQPDEKTLRPYTATDGTQILAAGLWSQPALAPGKLPAERFTVKCKYKVEGTVKNPAVRWNPASAFADRGVDWFAGIVSDCKVIPPS